MSLESQFNLTIYVYVMFLQFKKLKNLLKTIIYIYKTPDDTIYQPLRSGRICHKVHF